MKLKLVHVALAASLVVGLSGLSCSSSGPETGGGSGGSNSSSGGSNGSGGSGSGGSGSGGHVGSGGSGSGGSGSGGSASGGAVGSGGSASGGHVGSGGSASGGAVGSGGSASGGAVGTGGGSAGSAATGGGSGTAGNKGSGGGNGGAAGGSSGTATFAAVAQILGTNCATSMCHDGTAHVSLKNDSGLYARIVNGSPNGSMTEATCKTKMLIVPSDTSMSVISQIVKAPVTGCSDARMPNMCSTTSSNPRACLTMAQIATIDSWITAGAPM